MRLLTSIVIAFVLASFAVLAQEQECEPADVMIVFDKSGSMLEPEEDPRLPKAKDAAKTFVDLLQTDDKVGLVTFGWDVANLLQSLTFDKADVKTAIDGISTNLLELTCITCGINTGQAELDANGRADHVHAIVLLSDGVPTGSDSEADAIAAAGLSKAAGTSIFTIGIGDADEDLLKDIASKDEYYKSGTADDLEAIYEEIAGEICLIPDPRCGDGNLDDGEQCDDGNNDDGDGCSAQCMIEDTPNGEIPEFTTIGAAMALLGAGFYMYRKRQ